MMYNELRERAIKSVDSSIYDSIDKALEVAADNGDLKVKVTYKEMRENGCHNTELISILKVMAETVALRYRLEGIDVTITRDSGDVPEFEFDWNIAH